MKDKIDDLIEATVNEFLKSISKWDENTPLNWKPRIEEIEKILRDFLKQFILIIFKLD